MIELNLIPDVKLELLKARRQQAMVISGSIIATIAAGGLVAVLALYVFGGQALIKNNASSEITKQMAQLKSVKDLEKTLTVQQQISSINDQQNSKLISSRLFDVLSATVPDNKNKVRITTANLDAETKTIALEGEADNGYEALEVFKKTIADTSFSYLTEGSEERTSAPITTGLSDSDRSYGESASGQRVLRFKLTLSYPEELFLPASKSIRINPPQSGNITDSSNSVPKSLFTDKVAPETGEDN